MFISPALLQTQSIHIFSISKISQTPIQHSHIPMKSIFLYSKQNHPLNLEKINSCLYYDTQTDYFYRLNVMPQCTVFASEDVQQRQMMSLTRYDPAFYMIQILYDNKAVNASDLAHYLKKRNWSLFASEYFDQGKTIYSLDKNKVYNFLERKVQALEKYLDQHNPLDRLKLVKLEFKTISQDAISLLKNEIPQSLVTDFVKERFGHQESRKLVPEVVELQAVKPKPQGKNNKKPESKKEQFIPKNQQTLFGGSWGKK